MTVLIVEGISSKSRNMVLYIRIFNALTFGTQVNTESRMLEGHTVFP